ncbi:MAG TPA: hypothetical protein VNV82_25050 [Bryobacteraceae bacterium]|jgi:L-lactate permease|nr:hypothetical protein [Bryobacteraceae bacterium]
MVVPHPLDRDLGRDALPADRGNRQTRSLTGDRRLQALLIGFAFGSIAIPVVTLVGVTGLPLDRPSAGVGCICAPMSLLCAYIILAASNLKPAAQIVSPA